MARQIAYQSKLPKLSIKINERTFASASNLCLYNSMATTYLTECITVDPEICFGKPCIKGTRIRVVDVLDNLASGASAQEIVDDYPELTLEDISAALRYAAVIAARPVIIAA
jgi:uncharacterized protein (DUF433 family)